VRPPRRGPSPSPGPRARHCPSPAGCSRAGTWQHGGPVGGSRSARRLNSSESHRAPWPRRSCFPRRSLGTTCRSRSRPRWGHDPARGNYEPGTRQEPGGGQGVRASIGKWPTILEAAFRRKRFRKAGSRKQEAGASGFARRFKGARRTDVEAIPERLSGLGISVSLDAGTGRRWTRVLDCKPRSSLPDAYHLNRPRSRQLHRTPAVRTTTKGSGTHRRRAFCRRSSPVCGVPLRMVTLRISRWCRRRRTAPPSLPCRPDRSRRRRRCPSQREAPDRLHPHPSRR